jgi:HD-like signal output (HDOD) protein
MEKARILFVDDNQDILDGLSRALRHEKHLWDIDFINSGEEALEFMSASKVDAVVTDVRMPGVDGVQLLQDVSQLYPNVVRFILSGHAEEKVILQAAKLAHQFFPKPCNVDELKTALHRSLSLRGLLAGRALRTIISNAVSLPSLPEVYSRIVDSVSSPEVSVREIGEIIAGDPAISAKILHLVNSAFFGVGRNVSDVGEAVGLLGLDSIKYLVLSVELFQRFDQQKLNCSGFQLEQSIDHCIRVGLLAKKIAISEHADKAVVDESYLSGFLHDVGKLILADNMPEEYKKVIDLQQAEQIPTNIAEHKIIGTDHGAVGAYLLGMWGFSDAVLESVAFHHSPNCAEAPVFAPLTTVYIANILDSTLTEVHANIVSERIDFNYLSALNLESRLPVWRSFCEHNGDKQE